MWVTAYTDASYSDVDGGGWSVWLRCDRGRVVRGGKCPKSSINGSMLAEMYAIKQALILAKTEWADTTAVQVNTDCAALVTMLHSHSKPFRDANLRELQLEILGDIEFLQIHVRFKHVKGHTAGQGVRSYLNDQVDKMSRRMRKGNKRYGGLRDAS